MAAHPRKIIRAAVAALLVTPDASDPPVFPTAAKARFYDSRDFPLDARTMPVGVVYSADERIDPDFRHDGGVRRRIMELRVEFYGVGDAGAEVVDEGAFEVENAIHANPTINNLVEWCTLTGTAIAFAEQGEVSLWTAILTFEVIYYTHLVADETGRPTTVLLGFDPETGPGNEPDYVDVTDVI
ncbi:hypothetical protein EOB36_18095 [Mesorhizobium sp. M6A.T.Cr.TU.017.01.1.1]|uniref:hypothetical protein n=1 Tax=Mesorhizobium sp. M6A.T.Cr.TU.017.01.1.1 TaxID=2496774 RepID=UPI000FD432FC|nr:hypothetical protein [Mesorhizobium sp. M6A.T.Cr.TU.017.01.1.1]RUV00059.1 hypothetical protein EOB36_18095 [Mesorhizobium sp. M6A.T.Cr.TU.017.01.1.1]